MKSSISPPVVIALILLVSSTILFNVLPAPPLKQIVNRSYTVARLDTTPCGTNAAIAYDLKIKDPRVRVVQIIDDSKDKNYRFAVGQTIFVRTAYLCGRYKSKEWFAEK